MSGASPNVSVNQPLGVPSPYRELQRPPVEQVEQLPQCEVSQGAKSKREMSRQQWEDMKPLIQRIYIDENKPFPHLAHVLRTEHGFEPTKRQFSRKVEKWDFRKNVSRSERREILQNVLGNPDQKNSDIKDRRVGSGKLENWKRRYQKETSLGASLPTESSNLASATKKHDMESGSFSPSTVQNDYPESPMMDECNMSSSIQNVGPADMDLESSSHGLCDRDWAEVDVPGSPGLSPLLSALEIECSNSIPPLSLEEKDPEEEQYISNTQLLDLCNGENKSIIYDSGSLITSRQPSLGLSRTTRKSETRRLPLQNFSSAAGLCGWSPSPFNEIDVFPPAPKITSHKYRDGFDQPYWLALKSRAAEIEIKFSKLKPLLGSQNSKILASTKELAVIRLEQGIPSKAGTLFRRVARATQKIYGLANERTLDAWLDVVDSLQDEGKQRLAHDLQEKLHPTILKLLQPGHVIATRSCYLMCSTAMNLDDWDTAEELSRNILQVRLSTLGPSCKDTWKCMINLGISLHWKRQVAESDKLLHNALQLIRRSLDQNNDKYVSKTIGSLAMNCIERRQYEEAEIICRSAIDALEGSSGRDSIAVANLYQRMGSNGVRQGQLEESEAFYRKAINLHSKLLDDSQPALYCAEGLAVCLELQGRIDEATSLYQKVYCRFSKNFPQESVHVLMACYGLGQLYRSQGQHIDAIELYEGHVRTM